MFQQQGFNAKFQGVRSPWKRGCDKSITMLLTGLCIASLQYRGYSYDPAGFFLY